MNYKINLLFLFNFLFFVCFAQKAYKFPETFNSAYNFKPEEAHKLLLNSADAKKNPYAFEAYLVDYIYNNQYQFDNNKIYMDWADVEAYMIKLLDTIIPKSIDRKNLDIYINRNLSVNASTSRHGFVFCNLGLIERAENEAFLVGIIAHEIAHYLFKHHIKDSEMIERLVSDRSFGIDEIKSYYQNERKEESQADTFALHRLKKLDCNLYAWSDYFEMLDMKSRVYNYSRSYKNMLKSSELSATMFKERKRTSFNAFSSHPSYIERIETTNRVAKGCKNCTKNFLVDSVFFKRLKKVAREECKKIEFEKANHNDCLIYSFIDYLYEPKNPRNLYYIIESLRRLLYVKPELAKKGFLTENIDDEDLFYSNKSILYKPDYIFADLRQYNDLKNHPFFTGNKKPFNSYAEAFDFFTKEALKHNMNEANFSIALNFYGNQQEDSCKKYLSTYIQNGIGINIDLAKNLLANGRPVSDYKKTLIVYDNIGNYTGYDYNYYLAKKRMKYNIEITKTLNADTSQTSLTIMNSLLGNEPNLLYQYQSLENTIFSLYSDYDIDIYKKTRISGRETMEDRSLTRKYNKHLFIYAPEYYKWCNDKKIGKIFLTDIVYQYKEYLKEEEYHNTYTGYYLDMNALRPYFKDAIRNGFSRKQSEKEMLADFIYFLYGNE